MLLRRYRRAVKNSGDDRAIGQTNYGPDQRDKARRDRAAESLDEPRVFAAQSLFLA